jgi:hypothetical protein
MTASADECCIKWCNEAGDHTVHRQYLTSLSVAANRLLLGVNIVESASGQEIEMTTVPRHGRPVVVALLSDEAAAIGESLVEAAAKVAGEPARGR